MLKNEIHWFIGTIALVLMINFAFFGIDGFKVDAAFDVNIHDAYFIIPHPYFVFLICVFVFFGVYIIRAIRSNFKNLSTNLILMVSIIFLILILTGANAVLNLTWPTDPSLIANDINSEIDPFLKDFKIISDTIYAIQFIMLILLMYCGFKTGRNYRAKNKTNRIKIS